MIKAFHGSAPHEVVVEYDDGRLSPLPPRHDLRNHSPDGFSWGYGGSGPAQLALALLAKLYGAQKALRLYHDFKFRVIAGLPQDGDWTLTPELIDRAVVLLEQESAV